MNFIPTTTLAAAATCLLLAALPAAAQDSQPYADAIAQAKQQYDKGAISVFPLLELEQAGALESIRQMLPRPTPSAFAEQLTENRLWQAEVEKAIASNRSIDYSAYLEKLRAQNCPYLNLFLERFHSATASVLNLASAEETYLNIQQTGEMLAAARKLPQCREGLEKLRRTLDTEREVAQNLEQAGLGNEKLLLADLKLRCWFPNEDK